MKFSPRFQAETLSRLTDVSVAALLMALSHGNEDLPVGVLPASSHFWAGTRFAWAANYVSGEISAAPGVTVDSGSGLAVVWEVATAESPRGPGPAVFWAKRIVATEASWAKELVKRLAARMNDVTRDVFVRTVAEQGWPRFKPSPVKVRPRVDGFEPELHAAKRLEHRLRATFSDVDDLGELPSPADRRAFVTALGAGYSGEQVLDALRGQAEKCAKNRRWRDVDAAQSFLRISWVCSDANRFERAEQAGATLRQDPTTITIGVGGAKFVGGREVYE